ncbi:hypothetical protein [Pseudoduganella violacea]|uniref:Uncharacterized protein n=1 Tax=Pseudoduganella violacea TaxID=1715466 RepID=A0A7W5FVU2_9BURK|nr:hypothetical protein [Pseudoduganella violacea]MBB3121129.1 hypothetical protein [Pseudoduganella violacea]
MLPVHADEVALAQPPAAAQAAILRAIAELPPQSPQRRRYRLALAYGAPLFPADADLLPQPGEPANVGIESWLRLPAARRAHDVLITPDVDYFWHQDGVEYTTLFIVHLEQRGMGSALSVAQAHPTAHYGRKFHLLGRTGPGYYHEIQPIAPSSQAGADLEAFLAAALRPSPP